MSRASTLRARASAVDGVEGGDADFLDFAVDVLPLAGGFVEGNFLNEEIFGAFFDRSADAGELAGEVGKIHTATIVENPRCFAPPPAKMGEKLRE